MTTLARRIRELRDGRGLTQQQLGDKCGVDASAVSQWESGKTAPRSRRLVLVAEALGATVADFYAEAPRERS